MSSCNIAIVVGSLRKESYNRRFAEALVKLAPAHFVCQFSQLDDLPIYNQDDDAAPHPAVMRFKEEIAAADGVIFVTPEYNRSLPGMLKNVIDHGSRPYGQSVWSGKPAGVLGVSIGAIGTATAQQHLRNILAYLDMPTLGQPEAFIRWKDGLVDESDHIGADSRDFVQRWMDRYVAWVERHRT